MASHTVHDYFEHQDPLVLVFLLVAAVKAAGKMQKEVTEKRGQIDSLQTELRWLQDCYDAVLLVVIQTLLPEVHQS